MRQARHLFVLVAYGNFVALGFLGGLLGVAWPSIQNSFALSLDAVGVLLVATKIGFLFSSFNMGRLSARFGIGTLLLLGNLVAGLGLIGYALASSWWGVVGAALLVGAGGGMVDASMNVHFANRYGPRLMNWLHACFGLGITFGPVLMTAFISRGESWRWGYAIAGLVQGLLVLFFLVTKAHWHGLESTPLPTEAGGPVRPASTRETLRLSIIWLSLALFLMVAGIEITAGQWTFSLLTEARAVDVVTAGTWISIYWGSFTVGRILYGLVSHRLSMLSALRYGMVSTALGSALIWWKGAPFLSLAGLVVLGFAMAPIFPLLVSATPRRVGLAHATNAVGFQMAAAGVGLGLMPGLAGMLAERLGLEIVGLFLLTLSVLMIILHEMILHHERKARQILWPA